jgi:transposase
VVTTYRCRACGNRTRFDVVSTRRTRAFHHFTLGGECTVEEEELLESRVEAVTCRWCGGTSTVDVLGDAEGLPTVSGAARGA